MVIMMNIKIAFLLTILAGLSTMIGTFFIFVRTSNKDRVVAGSLAFASGVMLCVSITDLIPEALSMLDGISEVVRVLLCFLFVMVGIFLSIGIERVVPDLSDSGGKSLYKVGIISMIAIVMHNIPEGIATFISTTKSISLGASLAFAIALHNIPEGISISVPIYYATGSRARAFFYTLVSALSEPFGALITYFFLINYINDFILGLLFSLIAGIMLEISLSELLPTSFKYNYNRLTKVFFVIGILFMLLKFLNG